MQGLLNCLRGQVMSKTKVRKDRPESQVDLSGNAAAALDEASLKTRKSMKRKRRSDRTTESTSANDNVNAKQNVKNESKSSKRKEEENKPVSQAEVLDENETGEQTMRPIKQKKTSESYNKKLTDEERKRTVFVGNLPISATRKDIEKLFSTCGSVDTVRLRSIVPKDASMLKKVAAIKHEISTEAKDSVNAYVKFKLAADAEKAIKMNGHLFGGHRLQVDTCTENVKYDSKRSVFIGNLPFTAKDDELYSHFADCGEIERIRIVRDSRNGFSKGFGFVVFKEAGCVELALKLNGENFSSRPLRVTRLMKKFGDKKRNKIKQKNVSKDESRVKKAKHKNRKNSQKSLMQ